MRFRIMTDECPDSSEYKYIIASSQRLGTHSARSEAWHNGSFKFTFEIFIGDCTEVD